MTDSAFNQNALKDRDENLTTHIVLNNVLILFYLINFETANIEQNLKLHSSNRFTLYSDK